MNNLKGITTEHLTAPNLLSGFRIVAAPFILLLAWFGYKIAFLSLLAVALLTDALDGYVARKSHQITELGAKLDSWGDVINYLTIALSSWWLWPDIVLRELLYVSMVITSYLLPALTGILKFGSFTSYHTWSVKFAAASTGLTLFILYIGGPPWPFRIAAFLCIVAALEEILITIYLPEMRSNIRSIFDVVSKNRVNK